MPSRANFQADPATTFSGGNGGQAGLPAPIVTLAYVHSFTDRFKFGAAMFTAAGAALEYDSDWVGRVTAGTEAGRQREDSTIRRDELRQRVQECEAQRDELRGDGEV